MVKIYKNLSEQEWLNLRSNDITSTEAAAILGCPETYQSRLDVWYDKKNPNKSVWSDNERMKWGRRLESVIAHGIAEDHGMTIIKHMSGLYMRHDDIRAGSSFDFLATHPDFSGPGLLEIKNVDSLVFRQKWNADEDTGTFEAPLQIEVQVQHQLWISGYQWAAIGVLVGGNSSHLIIRERDEGAINSIERAVKKFWSMIDNDIMPEPDYSRDLQVLRSIYDKENAGCVIDESRREKVAQLVLSFEQAKERSKNNKSIEEELKAALIHEIGECAGDIFVDDDGNGVKFSFKTQTTNFKATEARTATTRVLRTSIVKPKKKSNRCKEKTAEMA